MEKLKSGNIVKQERNTEAMELFRQLDPKAIPMIFEYMCYLSEQDKQEEVKLLLENGEIYMVNNTMRLLSHQPLELDEFNKSIPEILQAFKKEIAGNDLHLYLSIYTAGVIDGKRLERKRRRRASRKTT